MTLRELKKQIKKDIDKIWHSDYLEEPWHVCGCEVQAWIVARIYEDFFKMLEEVE